MHTVYLHLIATQQVGGMYTWVQRCHFEFLKMEHLQYMQIAFTVTVAVAVAVAVAIAIIRKVLATAFSFLCTQDYP